jgi:UDP-N-acetylglucosamine--N-acetylmuramyl-(pentapeptide) pyrophosphoryl-undecaprenol N-acetylglucosamine transferase
MERLNVVFTGGGTGGHLYPAIAIAQALDVRANVTFIGTADRLEAKIVPNAGYPLVTVRARPLVRKLSLDAIATLFSNATGIAQALRALARLHPDIVIATGGYVCFPVVVAAKLLRLPVALLEPNAHPGLTNRLLVPLVDEVWGAFANADARFAGKYQHTGIPVRASLRSLPSRDAAVERLGLSPKRRTLLAVGGSQGARSINDALTSLVTTDGLPDGWQLVHVTGEKEYDRVRAALRQAQGDRGKAERDPICHPERDPICHPELVEGPAVRPYLHDMADAYAAADLVLARAGASTLGELAAIGKPAVLVPYPHAAEDHQRANAASVAELGAAVVVDDRELAAGKLRGILADVTQPSRLAALQAAAERARAGDPVTTILARVERLTARKKQP